MITKRETETTLTIVDLDSLYRDQQRAGRRVDPEPLIREALRCSRYFGSDYQTIALVAREDQAGINACQRHGYEIIVVNENRSAEINKFVRRMRKQYGSRSPRHLLVVTNDTGLAILWDDGLEDNIASLSVWVGSDEAQQDMKEYNCRLIEEMVPEYRETEIHALVDYENIHIGLKQRGFPHDPRTIVETIHAALADLGKLASTVAYADWGLLQNNGGNDIQRTLAQLGVETRYQINIRGKNSADMKIADDLRTLFERHRSIANKICKYGLITNDRDFRPIVETINRAGGEITIVGLSNGLSSDLRQVAKEVRYLDRYLPTSQRIPSNPNTLARELVALVMQLEVWLNCNGYSWAFADKVVAQVANNPADAERLRRAVDAGAILQSSRAIHASGDSRSANTYALNPEHPAVKAVRQFIPWVRQRITYNLNRGLEYVDTNFLARGIEMDPILSQMGIGRTRDDAEAWLEMAAVSGALTKKSRQHPKSPAKLITTWWTTTLKPSRAGHQEVQAEHAVDVEMPPPPVTTVAEEGLSSRTMRQILSDGLDVEQLRVLAFDDFREAYERIGSGMTKDAVVQLLVEQAIRQQRVPDLVQSASRHCPAVVARYVPQMAAA